MFFTSNSNNNNAKLSQDKTNKIDVALVSILACLCHKITYLESTFEASHVILFVTVNVAIFLVSTSLSLACFADCLTRPNLNRISVRLALF